MAFFRTATSMQRAVSVAALLLLVHAQQQPQAATLGNSARRRDLHDVAYRLLQAAIANDNSYNGLCQNLGESPDLDCSCKGTGSSDAATSTSTTSNTFLPNSILCYAEQVCSNDEATDTNTDSEEDPVCGKFTFDMIFWAPGLSTLQSCVQYTASPEGFLDGCVSWDYHDQNDDPVGCEVVFYNNLNELQSCNQCEICPGGSPGLNREDRRVLMKVDCNNLDDRASVSTCQEVKLDNFFPGFRVEDEPSTTTTTSEQDADNTDETQTMVESSRQSGNYRPPIGQHEWMSENGGESSTIMVAAAPRITEKKPYPSFASSAQRTRTFGDSRLIMYLVATVSFIAHLFFL